MAEIVRGEIDTQERRARDLGLHDERLRGRSIQKFFDIDLDAPSTPPEGIDELEAGNRIDPRQHRRILAPGMPFHMNGQQGFLHDILGIDPALYDLAPDKTADQRGNPVQKVGIGPFVSRDRGSHQPGKLGLILAAHKSYSPGFRALALICYVAGEIMSKANYGQITKVCGFRSGDRKPLRLTSVTASRTHNGPIRRAGITRNCPSGTGLCASATD